jgi:glycerol-3-phosphate dehydrogenase
MVPAVSAETDVIVVGAGLFGAMLTHRLTARGARVLLLEADDIGAHAARQRLMLDPGVLAAHPEVEGARNSRKVLAILEAQAPHLIRRTSVSVSTQGRWAQRRTLATCGVHDRHAGGLFAGAELASESTSLTLPFPVRLSAHTLDEARLTLALVLNASAHGAEVQTGARVEAVTREGEHLTVKVRGGALAHARTVVMTTGGDLDALTSPPRGEGFDHGLELLLSTQLTPEAFVDARVAGGIASTLEHLPYLDRSLVRVTADRPIDLDAALDHLFTCVPRVVIEVLDRQRAARKRGAVTVSRGHLPGLFSLSGTDLASGHREVQRLARELAGGDPHAGDDVRIEEGDFEVTPAIERTRLGSEILHVLAARHGERASAIVDRVMRAPREGTVVCPCSTVIEAELRHAHREEHASALRALSRRTELGVGLCNGVRCAHRAATILVEENLSQRVDTAPRGGLSAELAELFLSERAERASLEPTRAAVLRELARSMQAGAGLSAEAPPSEVERP